MLILTSNSFVIMQNYLAVALRAKFTLFYKFGEVVIPRSECLRFEREINQGIMSQLLETLKRGTLIEYASEIVVLHLVSDTLSENEQLKFRISELQAIYPITEQARVSMSQVIDDRIALAEPVFEEIWEEYENWKLMQLHRKGSEMLWHLCKMEGSVDSCLEQIGLKALDEGLALREQRKSGTGGNYWTHLIAYDRYEYFPKEPIGYFYDAGEAFAHSVGKNSFIGSQLHRFLESLPRQLTISEILERIIYSDQAERYISKTSEGGIKWYEIAPLFLQLRDNLKDVHGNVSKSYLSTRIEELKEKFPNSFSYVVALLGFFFGNNALYDSYYDSLDLLFYRKQVEGGAVNAQASLSQECSAGDEVDSSLYEDLINKIKQKGTMSIRAINQALAKHSNLELYKKQLEQDRRIHKKKQSYVYRSGGISSANEVIDSNSTEESVSSGDLFSTPICEE